MSYSLIQPRRLARLKSRRGFTLVEMLVAMAVTLIMMAAVARAFAFVGERIRESRGNVQLSNDLRDLTTRLNDELTRCTVKLTPNTGQPDQAGYFLYYEGPVTDATSSLFRTAIDADGLVDVPDSRYGDFDDYLAFTAIAPQGSWFSGKVPRYILDQKTAQLAGSGYTLPTDGSGFDPVVIRSRYAEIVYFVAPEYYNVPAGNANYQRYVDVDGDTDLGSGAAVENGLPDRMKIHRRVLLIRPDLNLASGQLPVQHRDVGGVAVPFMQADTWPSATTATTVASATVADGWAFGMAGVHQQCDLSVRRVLDANGNPTIGVAANSLADLALPHNRFAHVRVPHNRLTGSGGNAPTSMPVLALSGPATILNMNRVTGSNPRLAPPLMGTVPAAVVTPDSLCGFLRREFVLGNNATHLNPGRFWGPDRLGEDTVVNNVLGFDLKIYDPQVPLFSDTGLVVSPNDAGYRQTLIDAVASSTLPVMNGEFVDLCYPVLAGGSLRGWQARHLDLDTSNPTAPASLGTGSAYLQTPFSGLVDTTNAAQSYENSLYRSGRLVTTGSNAIVLFQPAFDTYTSHYEYDGFLQSRISATAEGTRWTTTTGTGVDLGTNGMDDPGIYQGGAAAVAGRLGPDDIGEHETLPPFLTTPQAVQISVRLENPVTRQVKQASVIIRD